MNRLIIGCGYLGKKVALALRRQGVDATGVVRSEAGVSALAALGIEALRVDLDDPDTPPLPLSGCELFYFAPPPVAASRIVGWRACLPPVTVRERRVVSSISVPPVFMVTVPVTGG